MSLGLDPSQSSVAEIRPSERQVVSAGPGSGKTEVVASLVANLLDEHAVDPDLGLLVVSFSNAAVSTVDRRLRESGLPPTQVQTLDSLARLVVRDLYDGPPLAANFDEVIALATTLLNGGRWDRLDEIEHLIVDEVQDVVGLRADFLLGVMKGLSREAGFTLLGDLAQSIYDFQLRPDHGRSAASTTSSANLLAEAGELGTVAKRRLEGQYRARTREAKSAMALHGGVLAGDASELRRFMASVTGARSIEVLALTSRRWSGRSVYLTQDNGQALLVARLLWNAGLRPVVRRSAHQRVVGAWVASLLADVTSVEISRSEFFERATIRSPHLDREHAWRGLRGATRARGSDLDLRELRERLARPHSLPHSLLDEQDAETMVSTVHRAKGLEFDNVALVEFAGARIVETEDALAPTREYFVAVTRARDRIVRVHGPDDRWLRRLPPRGATPGRWIEGGPKNYMTRAIEIRMNDVEPPRIDAADLAASQALLADSKIVGDDVTLHFDRRRSTVDLPVYSVLHSGHVIAQTTADFGQDLASRIGSIRGSRRVWPPLLGAKVISIATTSVFRGVVARRGLELVPLISGLATLDWKAAQR